MSGIIEFDGDLGEYLEELHQKKAEKKKARRREYYQENRERIKERMKEYQQRPEVKEKTKEYYQTNKEKIREHRQKPEFKAHEKKYRQRREVKEKQRNHQLKNKYGITLEDKRKLYAEQNGRCAICGEHKPMLGTKGKVICVDHNHKTGRVRGLLCTACNSRLHAFENKEWERKARKYLKKHQETCN